MVPSDIWLRSHDAIQDLCLQLITIGYKFEEEPMIKNSERDLKSLTSAVEDSGFILPQEFADVIALIGAVDLCGEWPGELSVPTGFGDPLVIMEARTIHALMKSEPQWHVTEGNVAVPLLPFSPDFRHKSAMSGGAPYSIELVEVDARVHGIPYPDQFFREYMARVLSHFCFCGLPQDWMTGLLPTSITRRFESLAFQLRSGS